MKRKYIDLEGSYLAHGGIDVVLYCVCGHSARVPRETLAKFESSSLHPLVDRARCQACGAIGEIPEIRVTPRNTGGFRNLNA